MAFGVIASKHVVLSAPLMTRLKQLANVTKDDQTALFNAVTTTRKVKPKSKIGGSAKHSSRLHLIQQGYACRYMELPNGRRQIVQLLLPGDIVDPLGSAGFSPDYEIVALTTLTYSEVDRHVMAGLVDTHPRLGRVLSRVALLNEAALYERIIRPCTAFRDTTPRSPALRSVRAQPGGGVGQRHAVQCPHHSERYG